MGKEGGKLHFGYKRHAVTDENGLILAEETTPANESDIKHLETPLKKAKRLWRTPVFADKGYDSAENKKILSRMKLKSRIMHKGTQDYREETAGKRGNQQDQIRSEKNLWIHPPMVPIGSRPICRACKDPCAAYDGSNRL